MKIFQKKLLSASVSTALTLGICSAIPTSLASDVSIYTDAARGETRILLMLDTSGSMGISSLVLPSNNTYGSPGDVKTPLCASVDVSEKNSGAAGGNIFFKEWAYNAVDKRSGTTTNGKTSFKKTVRINNKNIDYYLRGCGNARVDENGKLVESETGKFDRLSRLKDAVIQLLASDTLDDNVKIGLGHFSSRPTYLDSSNKTESVKVGSTPTPLVDGHSATILVPISELTLAQREKIITQLAGIKSIDTTTNEDGTANSNLNLTSTSYPNYFKASSGTPTAHAYAEAGAYMMGTTTGKYPRTFPKRTSVVYDGYAVIKNNKSTKNSKGEYTDPDYGKQLYYVCVGLDGTTGDGVPGTKAQFCNNEWNRGMGGSNPPGLFYDPATNGPGTDRIDDQKPNGPNAVIIYKPNGSGGWEPVLASDYVKHADVQANIKKQGMGTFVDNVMISSGITSVWTLHKSLPLGWRWGGWMKVEHEPLDIEPLGTKVWDHHSSDTKNMVSYRTSPFSLETTSTNDNTPFENMVGGFAYSHPDTKNATKDKYKAGGSTSQCDGNGIYFLTDGAPNSTKDTMAQAIMNESLLKADAYKFTAKPTTDTLISPPIQASVFAGETGGWEYIGAYAKKLKDKTKNPGNMSIKTAVVGFGASFEQLKNTQDCEALKGGDAYNACKWGTDEYGGGGFYYAENTDDIVASIVDFVRKVEVNIEPVVTGTPTIPVDALNPTVLQNNAYYASFQPTVSSASQLWVGNLNKYKIQNGELFSADGLERVITTNGALNKDAQGFWTDGALGQLKVGADIVDGKITTHRKIVTNRTVNASVSSSSDDLQLVDINALLDDDGAFATDTDKVFWLNALGYKIAEGQTGITKDNLTKYVVDKRLGAVMHSTPLLLTQEGRVSVNNSALGTADRKDYLLYGSTQGILHVVDVATGKEVFGFLPHEMMVNQKKALLLDDKTTGGMSRLFYGIDAPWVAHTQYTTTKDGLLTVKDSDRTETEDEKSDKLKGHQWVYGGLRMGGKSYYALDLSDINNPEMLFHINPSATNASKPLQRMGQSWSKPTLAHVNWGGEKKLVMFVGGGYDAEGTVNCTTDESATNKGYECPTYVQDNKVGAGVYMFDAENGDLLWWTSSDSNGTPSTSEIRFTENPDLQYSVVSQINAIDRNSDGLVDHLYFGDLAGQAFRVDLNNAPTVEKFTGTGAEDKTIAATKNAFARRTVTLFSENRTNGLSPRFYEMPSVSVHTDPSNGETFAAAAFSSGNRSTPLAGVTTAKDGTVTGNISANDGVFVVYDNDIAAKELYAADYTLRTTKDNTLQSLTLKDGVPRTDGSKKNAGWKHAFSNVAGTYKGMNDLYALDNMLYVNVFHKDGEGIDGSCGGGVKGDSYLYQYCLPFGKCDFYTQDTKEPNRVKLGAGILGTGIGQGYNNKISTLGLIVNRDDPKAIDCSKAEYKNLPQCQLFDNTVKLKQLRWYESR